MGNLNTLILDDCNIEIIKENAFQNVPSLEMLSIQRNRFATLTDALMIPSLKVLKLSGSFSIPMSNIQVPNEMFKNMENLQNLTMKGFDFNSGLQRSMLTGLTGLLNLDLSHSKFDFVAENAFTALENLQNLTMVHCFGFDSLPAMALKGPKNLEFIDLASTQIFPISGVELHPDNDTEGSPLSNIKVLNLSSSLSNIDDGIEILGLQKMHLLERLDISRNVIHNWQTEKFTNSKIETLVMKNIKDYISLTPAMISDFSKLKYLDISDNTFLCNEMVSKFYQLVEDTDLEVKNWFLGFGLVCVEDPETGNKTTFYEYATNGQGMNDAIPQPEDPIDNSKQSIIIGIISGVSGKIKRSAFKFSKILFLACMEVYLYFRSYLYA